MKITDIFGKRFNNLIIIKELPRIVVRYKRTHRTRRQILCKCDCGKEFTSTPYNIISGNTKSCGCYRTIATGHRSRKHGMSRTSEYDAWCRMRDRCYNKDSKDYKWYGAKGIRVCRRWLTSFDNFLADMGKKPTRKLSIERKNSKKSYTPTNCVWDTQKEQVRNQDRVIKIHYQGKKRRLIEVCEELGLDTSSIRRRLRNGWTLNLALTTPKGVCRKAALKSLAASKLKQP